MPTRHATARRVLLDYDPDGHLTMQADSHNPAFVRNQFAQGYATSGGHAFRVALSDGTILCYAPLGRGWTVDVEVQGTARLEIKPAPYGDTVLAEGDVAWVALLADWNVVRERA